MEQEEITKIYETLAPMAGDYANAQAEQIGQAQRSMGPMAANVMGQSQTSGLGNYTYNRLMRPQVDSMRDEILVQGYANQLNRLLSNALTSARNNYNRRSTGGGGNGNNDPDNTGTTGVTKINGVNDNTVQSNGTSWTALPNSFRWENEAGEMVTSTRPPQISDTEWLNWYNKKKKEAQDTGRKFEG